MRIRTQILGPVVAAAAALFLATSADAMAIATLTPFTGDAAAVEIQAEDLGTDIKFTVTVTDPVGDIRGVFFHIGDESLLSGLSITGTDVTTTDFNAGGGFAANGVNSVGSPSNNMNGGGTPCPCDFGVEIGTSGMSPDDIVTTMFTLTHTSEALDLSLVVGQAAGVRVTSVGAAGSARNGSSKLTGTFVPEPSTALLLSLGLLGLARSGRQRAAR